MAARPCRNSAAVSPAAVGGVGERDAGGIGAVFSVLGQARLLRGGFGG